MARNQREKDFCTDIKNEIKLAAGWAYKILDAPVSLFKDKARFSPGKAFDLICCAPPAGRAFAIEAKMWTNVAPPRPDQALKLLRKPTKKYRGQLAELRAVELGGGRAYVALKKYVPRASQFFLMRIGMEGEAHRVDRMSGLPGLAQVAMGNTHVNEEGERAND